MAKQKNQRKEEKGYALTTIGTVKALKYLQTGEGFVFYVRMFWAKNPTEDAKILLCQVIESIPEPWRGNIPDRAIAGLTLLAEGKTGEQALDELVAIEKGLQV